MEGIIRKWGNSLAWRIPRDVARQLGLYDGKKVNISLEKEGVTIKADEEFTINDFMEGLSSETRHEEVFGDSVGKERFWDEE